MKKQRILMAILPLCLFAGTALAQLVPDPFRHDIAMYFAGLDGKTWVGSASMLNANYTDTLHVRYDTVEKALFVRRVLVEADDQKIVSYGIGLITLNDTDSAYAISWTEKSFPEATGHFYWDTDYNQWRANFDGRWNQWYINVRRIDESSFEAGVARKVANFPAVELLDATYRCVSCK